MTKEELHEKYGFKMTAEIMQKRQDAGEPIIDPIYIKHLPAAWVIPDIYGHVQQENISLGKARELITAVIDEQLDSVKQEVSKATYQVKVSPLFGFGYTRAEIDGQVIHMALFGIAWFIWTEGHYHIE